MRDRHLPSPVPVISPGLDHAILPAAPSVSLELGNRHDEMLGLSHTAPISMTRYD